MSREAVAELFIKLGADPREANKALDAFEAGLKKGERQANVTEVALGTMIANGVAGLARLGKQAITAGLTIVENFAAAGDELDETSQKAGVAADQLQRLRYSAGKSGAETSTLTKALKDQNNALVEARVKATPFSKALDAIGLSLAQVEAMSPEQRFGAFGDALNKVDDEAKRTALAMDLVGSKAGPELLPLMLEGTAGLKAMGDEAERLGIVMSEDAIASAVRLQDALDGLKAKVAGASAQMLTKLAPAIGRVVDGTAAWFDANKDVIAQRLEHAIETLVPLIKYAAEHIDTIVKGLIAWKAVGIAKEVYEFEKQLVELALAFHAAAGPAGWITLATIAMVGFAKSIADAREEQRLLDERMFKRPVKMALNPKTRAEQEANFSQIAELERRVSAGQARLQDPKLAADFDEWNRVSGQLELDAANLENAQLVRSELSRKGELEGYRMEWLDAETGRVKAESAGVRTERTGGGRGSGGGRKVPAAKVTAAHGPVSDTDIMLAAFGMAGGSHAAADMLGQAGGGASPTAGAQIVRVDQSLTVTNNVKVEINGADLEGLDNEAAVRVIGDAIAKRMAAHDRQQMDHMRKATRY